ncbi:7-cyano-7-deazaguanine synthase QueC [Nocardiopsis ganjiahuensis]|uniref:7-cyano-7-deazaguanine synthase QueC n=1 Tax=Nocardiopsis ganjiahuensis TaxID=239984 RepID=UPI000344DD36|nr:7-cyano-7-deazaguanine synthase QueC [Nocardiopsis ganjiahuensis]
MANTTVLLSGGLDSTVLATSIVREHGADSVDTLTIHYGQRHVRELEAAAEVSAALGVRHDVIDLSVLGSHLTSALTPSSDGGNVPHGHYAEPTMAATVVPNRNAILLMVAVGVASARGHSGVATAVHAGDHPVYPDCRPEFVEAVARAAEAGTDGQVTVTAPFVDMAKAEIAALGHRVEAPVHLSWSCYEGGETHCGRCGTCVERAEAFHVAGLSDPTSYADTAFWRSEVV